IQRGPQKRTPFGAASRKAKCWRGSSRNRGAHRSTRRRPSAPGGGAVMPDNVYPCRICGEKAVAIRCSNCFAISDGEGDECPKCGNLFYGGGAYPEPDQTHRILLPF